MRLKDKVTLITGAGSGQGRVAAVEVSTDGGATWHPATGTDLWTYTFPRPPGHPAVLARAVDDSANIGPATALTL